MRLQDLTNEDLRRCPVWSCEGEADDVALVFPADGFDDPDRRGYIARTRFTLIDGSEWWGYCSPTDDSGLDYIQPVLLTVNGPVRFWYDESPPEAEPARACRLLGRSATQVFPVRFECLVSFEGQFIAGELPRIEVPILPGRVIGGPP